MKKVLIIALLIFVVGAISILLIFKGGEDISQKAMVSDVFEKEEKIIRQPAVAGQFYPGDPEELEKMIDQFLEKASPPETEGEIFALVLPHAGYPFSGPVAAYGFKQLMGGSSYDDRHDLNQFATVILIGNSHYERFEGISIFPRGFYKTPLGEVEIDSQLAEKIIAENERIFFRESVHQREHSLEVELPFLQVILRPKAEGSPLSVHVPRIVPIILGNSPEEDYKILAQAIVKNIRGKNILLIASSDLSHYPSYGDAQQADSKTIEAILTGRVGELEKTIQDLEKENIPGAVTFVCAEDAIKTIMLVAKELAAEEIKLLKYANSGDVPIGDKSQVVGYAAIGFFGPRQSHLLKKTEQEKLLEIAKNSVETFVKEGKIPEFQVEESILNQNLGAFVTLKKQSQLRGCIGRFSPTDIPLYQVVSQMAIAAATQDKRFYPVGEDELGELDYEISVLSPLEKIDNWQGIEIGKHGVQIRKGLRNGVFLPQVATDNNWDLEKFMGELCFQKVGLPWDCWKEEDIDLYTFTAQIFEEEY